MMYFAQLDEFGHTCHYIIRIDPRYKENPVFRLRDMPYGLQRRRVANGINFLVTRNFRHIANAAMRTRIELVCWGASCEPSVICTPNELMETNHEEDPD